MRRRRAADLAPLPRKIEHSIPAATMQASVSNPQSRDRSGRWPRGISGNPGGRPQGLARATRELVGEDGQGLAGLWWTIAQDPLRGHGTVSKPPGSWPTGAGARRRFSPRRRVIRSTWLRWRGRLRSSGPRSFGWLRSRKQARTEQWLQASRRHRRGLRGRVTCGPLRGPTALPAGSPETRKPRYQGFLLWAGQGSNLRPWD